jgi:predicted kinase
MQESTSSSRPWIVVLVGLPGSGKSTYMRELGVSSISSDACRHLLSDDETNQTINRQVFAAMRYLLRHRLLLHRSISYIDATHLTPRERRPYIAMADLYDCSVAALYFDVPLDICKQRNLARARVVPDEAMDLLASRLVPPSVTEGFQRVVRLSELAKGEAPVPTGLPVSK